MIEKILKFFVRSKNSYSIFINDTVYWMLQQTRTHSSLVSVARMRCSSSFFTITLIVSIFLAGKLKVSYVLSFLKIRDPCFYLKHVALWYFSVAPLSLLRIYSHWRSVNIERQTYLYSFAYHSWKIVLHIMQTDVINM